MVRWIQRWRDCCRGKWGVVMVVVVVVVVAAFGVVSVVGAVEADWVR